MADGKVIANKIDQLIIGKTINITQNRSPGKNFDNSSTNNGVPLRKLRDVLVVLYDRENDARRIVDDAGLTGANIKFGETATDCWHNILKEFSKKNKIDKLMEIVFSEYGDNEDLKNAWQEYCSLKKKR